jgi:hypothetical protein
MTTKILKTTQIIKISRLRLWLQITAGLELEWESITLSSLMNRDNFTAGVLETKDNLD